MTPLFFNNPIPNNFYPTYNPNLYQAYQALNLKAYNTLLLKAQEEALKSQLLALNEMRARVLQGAFKPPISEQVNQIKTEDIFPPSNPHSPLQIVEVVPDVTKKIEVGVRRRKKDDIPKKRGSQSKTSNTIVHKEELEEMIMYVLNSVGKVDQAEINKARKNYVHKSNLVSIFDTLVAKYVPVKKHREDIIRYVIRRALKFMKKSIIEKEKIYGKRAYAALCKKYFRTNYEELEKMGVNTQDEKELIEFLLPYRKNSKNRTMNTDFTSEIFSSEEFCQDYEVFMKSFDKSLNEDNNKKVKKLITLAEECLKKNNYDKIKNCTRLPWLQAWVDKTRDIASNLLSTEAGKINNEDKFKKIKTNCPSQKSSTKSEDFS